MDLTYRFDPYAAMVPKRIESPESAIRTLAEGNRQFVTIVNRLRSAFEGDQGEPIVLPLDPLDFGVSMVEGVSMTQSPFAIVLGCSDARAPIELIFHQTCNDLFVVRVAGNVLGVECLGSIDYAVRNMVASLKLVVVLGHLGCGAVTAAVDMYLEPTDYPDLGLTHSLRSLVDRVMIAVRGGARALERSAGANVAQSPNYRAALIEVAIYLNAALTAFDLRHEMEPLGDHGMEVVYGVFNIVDQTVRPHPPGASPSTSGQPFAHAPTDVAQFDQLAAGLVRSIVERGLL